MDLLISIQDVPFENKLNFTADAAMILQEIIQMLEILNIKQLMTDKYYTVWNNPMVWKLFGCLFNRFGLCMPKTSSTYGSWQYNTETRPAALSKFQKYYVEKFPRQVLVFKQTIPFELVSIHTCIHNLLIDQQINVFDMFPKVVTKLILDFAKSLTELSECFLYEDIQEEQRQQDQLYINETQKLLVINKRIQEIIDTQDETERKRVKK